MFPYPGEGPQYFTAYIRYSLQLLATYRYKTMITDSLRFMVEQKLIKLPFRPISYRDPKEYLFHLGFYEAGSNELKILTHYKG